MKTWYLVLGAVIATLVLEVYALLQERSALVTENGELHREIRRSIDTMVQIQGTSFQCLHTLGNLKGHLGPYLEQETLHVPFPQRLEEAMSQIPGTKVAKQ